jgi:hypothetical protein
VLRRRQAIRSLIRLFPDKMINDDLRFCLLLVVFSKTHQSQIVLRRRQEIRSAIRLFPDKMVNDDLCFCLLLLVSSRTHQSQIVLRKRQKREVAQSGYLTCKWLMTTFAIFSSSS